MSFVHHFFADNVQVVEKNFLKKVVYLLGITANYE